MKDVRKTIIWMLSALLVVVLAACSSNDGGSTGGDSGEISGDFEIQYFVGGYGDGWWKQVIAEFEEKYPDLKVKQSAGSQINDQMRPRWIQGDPPDVVYIDGAGSNETQMVLDDQLMDLTDWYRSATNVHGEKISDLLITEPYDYDGTYYSMPLVFGSWGTFYDKKLFADNGWEVPTDFESFMAVSEQIQSSGISPYIHTGIYPYYVLGGLIHSAIVAENGGDGSILKDMANNKEGAFKSEPVLSALEKIVQMRDKGYIDPSSTALNHTDSQIQFLQHRAAFIPNGLWLPAEMEADVPDGFEFGFIPSIMHDKGDKYVAISYTNTIAIAKDAKNPAAAKAFLEFIFTKQQAVEWAEITGAIMNVKTDLESSQANEVAKHAMSYFNGDDTVVAPFVLFNEDVQTEMQNATISLLTGDITPEQWGDRIEAVSAKFRD